MEKTDLFRYEECGLQTQKQERSAQLTEAAECRGNSRITRHFRRHSPLRRHTHNFCPHISRLRTSNSPGGTRTRLNNRKIKRCQYHGYSPSWSLYSSFSSLSFIFVFTVFNFYGHFILSLCLHCYYHHHHHHHHHCHNPHQLTAVSFVGTVVTLLVIVTAVIDSHAIPVAALEFVGAAAFVWRGCRTWRLLIDTWQ